ncbi:hypothetical protein ACB092_01G376200 [Castanea dentata]
MHSLSTKSRKLNCSANMAEMRWILPYFTAIALLLLMSQSLPGSAHESVLNPLSRVLVGQHGHLQHQENAVADNSIYNRKLGLEVDIKKKGGLGRRARGRASSATPNRISSFHVASFLCISLFLRFFMT